MKNLLQRQLAAKGLGPTALRYTARFPNARAFWAGCDQRWLMTHVLRAYGLNVGLLYNQLTSKTEAEDCDILRELFPLEALRELSRGK